MVAIAHYFVAVLAVLAVLVAVEAGLIAHAGEAGGSFVAVHFAEKAVVVARCFLEAVH